MTAGTGHESFSSRLAAPVLALAALAAAFCFVAPPAYAQEGERIGILNRLLSPFREEAERPKPKAVVVKPAPRRKKPPRVRTENAEEPQVAVITKRPDAHVVLVIGDFLASGLAEGLTTAVTQNPNIRIVDRSNGSSGFVRKDFYDWGGKINELISEEKPSAIVVMIGANDRQQMLVDGVREEVRSENWNKEYAARAKQLGSAIAARKVPFLWVGMPPFKSSKMMLDMIAFNDVYRAAAAENGGEFIDIWDGFVDENGAYVSNGPDVNGQPARLRANDGINLARPGKRKVAFYAEKPLYKLLGEDPAAAAAQANALAARPAYRIFGPFGPSEPQPPVVLDILVNPNEVGPIDPARPVALRTPGLDGGTELLGAVAEPRREARTPAERLVIEGLAPKPPAGRADQFAGPQLASAAAVTREINVDRTTNKKLVPPGPLLTAVDHAALRMVRSNVLAEPQPPVTPRIPPEIRPDRLEEISPAQAAPDEPAPEPPLATPNTIGKDATPEFAKGDPLDLSPARGAPDQAYKRPRSIGPEPNRAPTAVPPPVEEIFAPAEAEPGVPSASAGESADEPAADAMSGRPDTAPARAPAPSAVPGLARDAAPARSAPGQAAPVPVAELPATKAAPSELLPAPEAPTVIAPNAPVEPAAGIAAAKAVPATGHAAPTANAPARPAPASEAVEAHGAPARSAPSEAIDSAPAAPARVIAIAPPAGSAEAEPDGSAVPDTGTESAILPVRPETPVAPAPPSVLSEPAENASPGAQPGSPNAEAPRDAPPAIQPTEPATPVAPAPPTILPERASTPPATRTDRRATAPQASGAVPETEVASIRAELAADDMVVIGP